MSFIAMNQSRSRRIQGNANTGANYGSSSVARRSDNIVTASQGYDNYYGKSSVQK